MAIESEKDLIKLQRIGWIVALGLRDIQSAIRPGVTTAHLDKIGARVLRKHGAESAPKRRYGFPTKTIVCVNEKIPAGRTLENSDLVTINITAERGGYIADAAVTVVAGQSELAEKRLVACSKRALDKALSVATTGRPIRRIGSFVETEVNRLGFPVVRELMGHDLGGEIHQWPFVPNYDAPWANSHLQPEQVLTIEPIISDGNGTAFQDGDGWTVRTDEGALSSYHEHSIVITKGRPIILATAA